MKKKKKTGIRFNALGHIALSTSDVIPSVMPYTKACTFHHLYHTFRDTLYVEVQHSDIILSVIEVPMTPCTFHQLYHTFCDTLF